jgi:hypothetical protein
MDFPEASTVLPTKRAQFLNVLNFYGCTQSNGSPDLEAVRIWNGAQASAGEVSLQKPLNNSRRLKPALLPIGEI